MRLSLENTTNLNIGPRAKTRALKRPGPEAAPAVTAAVAYFGVPPAKPPFIPGGLRAVAHSDPGSLESSATAAHNRPLHAHVFRHDPNRDLSSTETYSLVAHLLTGANIRHGRAHPLGCILPCLGALRGGDCDGGVAGANFEIRSASAGVHSRLSGFQSSAFAAAATSRSGGHRKTNAKLPPPHESRGIRHGLAPRGTRSVVRLRNSNL